MDWAISKKIQGFTNHAFRSTLPHYNECPSKDYVNPGILAIKFLLALR